MCVCVCVCVCVFVCSCARAHARARVCVCHNDNKVTDKRQARHTTSCTSDMCKHYAEKKSEQQEACLCGFACIVCLCILCLRVRHTAWDGEMYEGQAYSLGR